MSKLKVAVDRILPITEARARFNGLVEEVAGEAEGMYVLTKGGTPVVAVVNVGYLERLMELAEVDGDCEDEKLQPSEEADAASPLPDQANESGLTVVGGLEAGS